MSAVQATRRQPSNFGEKMIGMGKFEIVEFNKELDSDGKEIKYLGETKDGVPYARVAITVKEVKTGKFFPLSFFLEDSERLSKDGKKKQYINEVGKVTWTDDVDNLSEKFTAYPYRVAKKGEEELVNFINAWLCIDHSKPVKIELDWAALMNGNVKELRELQKCELAVDDKGNPQTICAMAIVEVREKDGEIKESQKIYERKLLAGWNMKNFVNAPFTEERLQKLRDQDSENRATRDIKQKKWLKAYEQFAIDVTDSEYGIKGVYFLGELKPYDPTEAIVTTDKVLSEEDASY